MFEVSSGRLLHEIRGHSGAVTSVCFAPNPQQDATASPASSPTELQVVTGGSLGDSQVRLWRLSSSAREPVEVWNAAGHTAAVLGVVVVTDESITDTPCVISGSDDCRIIMWRLSDGAKLREFQGHTAAVNHLTFFSSLGLLVSASDDETVRMWDVRTGEEKRVIRFEAWANGVAVSPDGQLLAVALGRGLTVLCSTATGDEIRRLTGHDASSSVWRVVFSPSGTHLVSSSWGTWRCL